MEYSQKDLIELFKKGAVPSESSVPQHIETVISNVFVFPTTVYKVYKSDNEFFNKNFKDISIKKSRFDFTRKDFDWNHTLSPEVYLEIRGATVGYNQVTFVPPSDEADELVIVMHRVHGHDFLYEQLMSGEVTPEDGAKIGTQLAQALKRVRPGKLKGYDYYHYYIGRINDVREWIRGVSDLIPEEEWSKYTDYLDDYREKNKAQFEQLSTELANAGDLHSHNAIYRSDKLNLMDTYPPKDDWMIEYHMVPIYRLGTCLWALGNKEIYDRFMEAYIKEYGEPVDRNLDGYYHLYAATIQVSYLYMLQRTDPDRRGEAERMHSFIREHFAKLPPL